MIQLDVYIILVDEVILVDVDTFVEVYVVILVEVDVFVEVWVYVVTDGIMLVEVAVAVVVKVRIGHVPVGGT